jgi:hypothetical protein
MLFCDSIARSTRWTLPWRMQPSKVSCGAGIGAQTMRAMQSISGFRYADHGRAAIHLICYCAMAARELAGKAFASSFSSQTRGAD